MQSNFFTIKTIRKHAKQETGEKHVKTAYKGKQWHRGTDKRELYNYCLQGALK